MVSNTTVVAASDNNAFPGLMVLSASVAINHQKGRLLFIYFIDCGLSDENKKMLSDSLFAINPMARCEFRKPDARKLTGLRVETAGLFTYARLVSAELFPEIKRAIYLDTDVVVNRDLGELFDLDLCGFPIGAVQDRFTPVASHPLSILDWQNRGISADEPFFNAGVLLIDYARWREEKIGERALEFARGNKDICVRWDQTALNILLYKDRKSVL
jgi:lipopolysaccharide biosynthesis glycosyltransferase